MGPIPGVRNEIISVVSFPVPNARPEDSLADSRFQCLSNLLGISLPSPFSTSIARGEHNWV